MDSESMASLLRATRAIWGDVPMSPERIAVAASVVCGDIARLARNEAEGSSAFSREDWRRELGNLIVSGVRWADDLGLDPMDCVSVALEAQQVYRAG